VPRLPSAFLDQGRHDLRGYQAAAAPVVRGHLADHQPQEGIASTTLAKDLKITQKSAWFVLHRLRYAARTRSFNRPLGSEVELDESYFGAGKPISTPTSGSHRTPAQPLTNGSFSGCCSGELRAKTSKDMQGRTVPCDRI